MSEAEADLPLPVDMSAGLPDVGEMPAPSAHVVAPAAPEVEKPAGKAAGRKSPTGEVWDAALHESPPRLATRSGTWARLRLGRPRSAAVQPVRARRPPAAASVAAPPPDSPTPDAPPPGADAPPPVDAIPAPDYAAMGEMASEHSFLILEVVAGPDGAAEDGEKPALAKAYEKYFAAKAMADISPGWGLVAVATAILAKRAMKPTVRSRVIALYLRFREFIAWLKSPIAP